jgi:hypothetical protein
MTVKPGDEELASQLVCWREGAILWMTRIGDIGRLRVIGGYVVAEMESGVFWYRYHLKAM